MSSANLVECDTPWASACHLSRVVRMFHDAPSIITLGQLCRQYIAMAQRSMRGMPFWGKREGVDSIPTLP